VKLTKRGELHSFKSHINSMIMFSIFSTNPVKKLNKQYERLMKEARDIQRSGDLRLYAKKIEEAELLAKRISSLSTSNAN
jgi:hypothetical protein